MSRIERRLDRVRLQDPLERADEEGARVIDEAHELVGLVRVDQEQDDPDPDQGLNDPEQEDDGPSGDLGTARRAADGLETTEPWVTVALG